MISAENTIKNAPHKKKIIFLLLPHSTIHTVTPNVMATTVPEVTQTTTDRNQEQIKVQLFMRWNIQYTAFQLKLKCLSSRAWLQTTRRCLRQLYSQMKQDKETGPPSMCVQPRQERVNVFRPMLWQHICPPTHPHIYISLHYRKQHHHRHLHHQ